MFCFGFFCPPEGALLLSLQSNTEHRVSMPPILFLLSRSSFLTSGLMKSSTWTLWSPRTLLHPSHTQVRHTKLDVMIPKIFKFQPHHWHKFYDTVEEMIWVWIVTTKTRCLFKFKPSCKYSIVTWWSNIIVSACSEFYPTSPQNVENQSINCLTEEIFCIILLSHS